MFRFVAAALMICALLLMVGCAKAPEQEIQTAKAAMDVATSAEAEAYASDAYRMAMDTLNAAEAAKQAADAKFSLFRSYGKSKELYARAEVLAKEAQATAESEKELVKVEAADMLTQAKQALDDATAALAKAPRGKGSKADIELIKNDLTAASAKYDEAKTDFDAGKYAAARTKLEAVMQKAQSLSEEIAKAASKKTGR
jgi:multidrug resistance efflux pump